MDIHDAIETAETAIRYVITELLGEDLDTIKGAPSLSKARSAQKSDAKKRPFIGHSDQLIDYIEFSQLTEIIKNNIDSLSAVFPDSIVIMGLIKHLANVRNTIAHSRPLTAGEENLTVAASAYIRDRVIMYRSELSGTRKYYPAIDSVLDNWSQQGSPNEYPGSVTGETTVRRVEVGDVITFKCQAHDPLNRQLHWRMRFGQHYSHGLDPENLDEMNYSFSDEKNAGENIELTFTVSESEIGENLGICVQMRSEGKYYMNNFFDDERWFWYAVNPPLE